MRRSISVLVLLLAASDSFGFSLGSPICEVNSLPLTEMSPTLASPPPSGWTLETERAYFSPGASLRVRVRHPSPLKQARGILLWAKRSQFLGGGRFELPASGAFQYIPAPAACGEWAISHVNATPKSLDDLQFDWIPDTTAPVILRAFIIEECFQPSGGCRDQQALTPIVVLEEGVLVNGFEAE